MEEQRLPEFDFRMDSSERIPVVADDSEEDEVRSHYVRVFSGHESRSGKTQKVWSKQVHDFRSLTTIDRLVRLRFRRTMTTPWMT